MAGVTRRERNKAWGGSCPLAEVAMGCAGDVASLREGAKGCARVGQRVSGRMHRSV